MCQEAGGNLIKPHQLKPYSLQCKLILSACFPAFCSWGLKHINPYTYCWSCINLPDNCTLNFTVTCEQNAWALSLGSLNPLFSNRPWGLKLTHFDCFTLGCKADLLEVRGVIKANRTTSFTESREVIQSPQNLLKDMLLWQRPIPFETILDVLLRVQTLHLPL